MKTKIGWEICFALILLLGTYGCSTSQPTLTPNLEASFQNIIQVTDINKSMTVKTLGTSVNKLGHDIRILIENTTNYQILLPADYGNKVFVIRNGQWIEISNSAQYNGEMMLLPLNLGGIGYEDVGDVWAVLNLNMSVNSTEPETLRIFVQGVRKNAGQPDHPVGAYVDTLIEP